MFSELCTASSLVLSTRAQHIWLEGTPAIVYAVKSAFQNDVLRPLGGSKTDTGIVLAQRLAICAAGR